MDFFKFFVSWLIFVLVLSELSEGEGVGFEVCVNLWLEYWLLEGCERCFFGGGGGGVEERWWFVLFCVLGEFCGW